MQTFINLLTRIKGPRETLHLVHQMWDLALKESRLEIIGSENCENLHPICVQKVWKYILETLKNFVPKMHIFRINSILFQNSCITG